MVVAIPTEEEEAETRAMEVEGATEVEAAAGTLEEVAAPAAASTVLAAPLEELELSLPSAAAVVEEVESVGLEESEESVVAAAASVVVVVVALAEETLLVVSLLLPTPGPE